MGFKNETERMSFLGAVMVSQDMRLNAFDYMDYIDSTFSAGTKEVNLLAKLIFHSIKNEHIKPDLENLIAFKSSNSEFNLVTPDYMVECVNLCDIWLKRITKEQFSGKPYTYYLKSYHWERIRNDIKLRDRSCRLCNNENKLQVHHRTYDRLGFELGEDLILLCGDCHQMFHNYQNTRKMEAS